MEAPQYQETERPGNLSSWAEYKTPRGFMVRDETCKLNRYKSLEAAEAAFDLHEKAKGVPCGIVECTCGWWHIKPIPK